MKNLYIQESSGYTHQIGHLVSMMDITRAETINLVKELSTEQLNFVPHPKCNSIGSLLLHITAIEITYQRIIFENRNLSPEEAAMWQPYLTFSETPPSQEGIGYYLNFLSEVRTQTLDLLRQFEDAWLYKSSDLVPANIYYLWFHVIEEEINHRGQIKWLKKFLPQVAGKMAIQKA